MMRAGIATRRTPGPGRRLVAVLALLAAGALAACDGTAVVTLTASQTHFLAYRVSLVRLTLEDASGSAAVDVLPAAATVDLARLVDVDEVIGAASAVQGTYTSAVLTLDYSGAQIVADDGTANGVPLTAVDASGLPLGRVSLTVRLDPKEPLRIAADESSRVALDFKLAASNTVDLALRTVIVRPMIAASTASLDAKPVLVRGAIESVGAAAHDYTSGIAPFDWSVHGAGRIVVAPADTTVYEVDGVPSTGSAGFAALARLGRGARTVAYGTWIGAGTAAPGTGSVSPSAGNLAFAATEVQAGESARSARFDSLSGIVTARSGDTLRLSGATLVPALAAGGAASAGAYVSGTATLALGAGTEVTAFGQPGTSVTHTAREISVGSRLAAFGAAATDAAGNVALDATAGRVRLYAVTAGGLVRQSGTGTLTITLATLGGRAAGAFAFAGTGATAGGDADPAQYLVATGALGLANAGAGTPIEASGFVAPFGAAPPDFEASSLADRTTVPAVMSLDWGAAGASAPFASLGSAQIVVDARAAFGARHTIDIGAESVDVATLAGDPTIAPDGASTAAVFAIGHAASATIDSFERFADFAIALQSDLAGARATGLTAEGTYAPSTRTLSATAVTVYLAD